MPRKEFPRSVKAAAFLRANGVCENPKCGARLSIGKFDYDHDNPDGLTGEPTLENCRVLCLPCHSEKTKGDVARIAKAKRQQAKHIGAAKPSKRSFRRWRKFDGTIVERRT